MIKIATLNLCLGLPNKKNVIKQMLNEHNINILCMQETEIVPNLNCDLLSIPGYYFEAESNDTKIRTGIYIDSGIKYERRKDLEGNGLHLVIVDIKNNKNL